MVRTERVVRATDSRNQDHDRRDGDEHVRHAHQQLLQETRPLKPATVPIATPISVAIRPRHDADQQRGPDAEHELREDVVAEVVGAEWQAQRRVIVQGRRRS